MGGRAVTSGEGAVGVATITETLGMTGSAAEVFAAAALSNTTNLLCFSEYCLASIPFDLLGSC